MMGTSPRQASRLLLSDLVESILRFSDNPGECARYITAQIRELVGVRSVGLLSELMGGHNQIISVCPQRTLDLWSRPEVREFVSASFSHTSARIIEPTADDGHLLTRAGIGTSFTVPLMVGNETAGILILLDLFDLKGTQTILQTLESISPILALIIRNAILFRNMEKMVEEKTAALSKSEQLFRGIFDQSPDGILFIDVTGSIVAVNHVFAQSHGYSREEIIELGIAGLDPEGSGPVAQRIQRVLAGEVLTFEVNHRHKDGHLVPLEVTASSIRSGERQLILVNHRDISARKKAEEEHERYEQQIQLNSRLESLGILAGGIAHDFNNLLGGIFGYVDMAAETTTEKNVGHYLAKVITTIDRARALTGQLLTFAKGGDPVKRPACLSPFIEETARFALSGSNVSCSFSIADDIWPCEFDKNQVGQVIDNIVINAKQAMPAGGTISIAAVNAHMSTNEHALLNEGPYVRISITDSGIGIPQEILPRIFDPFFTTKSSGHGLGLATCYSIIHRHGGCIDVCSHPGKGSTFTVYLPASPGAAADPDTVKTEKHAGRGIFLVMDDEEVMRESLSAILQTFGYTVVCTADGQEAVDYVAKTLIANQSLAGMMFDLTVPGAMGGREALERIRQMGVPAPAFVASGYADDPIVRNPAGHGFTASICKPFLRSELVAMLEKHMGNDR